jgi:hypothetical protein
VEEPSEVEALKETDKGNRNGKVVYLGLWYHHHALSGERPEQVTVGKELTYWLREQHLLYFFFFFLVLTLLYVLQL